jgi:hypothetical protein
MSEPTSHRTKPSRHARTRIVLLCAIAALVASSAIGVSGASASRSQSTLFDLGGSSLDVTKEGRATQLDELQDFGVDTVRVIIAWRQLAPSPESASKPSFDATDPNAYPAQWDALDDLVIQAKARGMNVLMTPSAPTPKWASGGRDGITNPSAFDFGQFVQALGTRYSGTFMTPPPVQPTDPPATVLPRVNLWSVYNEPNLTLFLKPQIKHGKSVAAKIYRNLFLAAQKGLAASGHASDQLLIGETSPGPGRSGTAPIDFLRGVFCLNEKFKRVGGCPKIDADGWAQHPYDPFDAPFEEGRHNLVNLATIGDLVKALNKAKSAGAVKRRLPVYVTEYGIESVPDKQFGVSQVKQAEYNSISEYLMWRNSRIRSYGQYLLQDDKGNAQTNFQTGLRDSNGNKKASYNAFSIALVAQRVSAKRKTVTIWGHVRPKGAPYSVTVKANGSTIKTIGTNAAGYFQFRTTYKKGRRYSASTTLADGTELSGPSVRVYTFPTKPKRTTDLLAP